ncbi:helix-hairpin-helix domain-containing protein [Oscillibacter sp.]|uniref:ComEA family DNA-binding protein n=1 Tax=Oscillibacter sp. TaxID=1945593 RepID=UPI002628C462|nr:helix-hairpin-helix domain-containing protein [Oscillibacter sp.]MDD3346643.1 helix-hairpin-helix domain-containing protein [Oscillibacter sp.]
MNERRRATKTETILLGMTALFLCILLALFLHDRKAAAAAAAVETDQTVPQEMILPDVSPLDLNTATAEELETLPGIGPALASRIVSYRASHGPFETIEEIMEVPGIGQGKFEGLRESVTVEEEGTT